MKKEKKKCQSDLETREMRRRRQIIPCPSLPPHPPHAYPKIKPPRHATTLQFISFLPLLFSLSSSSVVSRSQAGWRS
ncbi:uncharacterized protein BDV14DRAFT_52701 [Aspergillus stella-maris]|uniref:uncharacterized protein n=1 Tax=Aspergillus stella-maris TaxID=1810926 RepID=UPI003CCCEB77